MSVPEVNRRDASPLRVLHVLCDLSPGGAERLVLELARRASSDVRASVATVLGGGGLEAAFRAANVPLQLGDRRRGRPSAAGFAALRALARDHDVVHTHLYAGDVWGRLAALDHPCVISTDHNTDRDESWQRVARACTNPIARVVVAVSDAVARRVRGARSVVVIPNGVDLGRFDTPHVGGDGRRALAVGRRAPQKGFDLLLRALPPDMTLDVAGEGPYAPAHPRVRWLGRREDIPALLAAADMLVVPSRWEGFGLAAAEGLAAGVPVVAFAVDGLVEVVADAGILVPPGDTDALRAAMARLRDDPALRAELGARGRARARARFDLGRMRDAYEALWRGEHAAAVTNASRARRRT